MSFRARWSRRKNADRRTRRPHTSICDTPGPLPHRGTTHGGFEPLENRVLFANTGAPPVLTGSGTPASFQENGPPVAVDAGLTLTDEDGASETIDGAFVTIAGGFVAAEDVLAFTPVAGITGNYNAASGVLVLNGTASVGDYQTVLRSVTYDNTDPSAAPDARTISFSIAPGALFNPETGHFYDFVSDYDILWTEARADAESRTLFGLQGYLATITSQQENDFAASKLEQTGWMGASDAAVEGEWRWVTGPEGLEGSGQGQLFWTGKYAGHLAESGVAVNGAYTNWNTQTVEHPGSANEPNDQGQDASGEDYGHMLFDPFIAELGKWNDLADSGPFDPYIPYGYLVEYGGMPNDPTLSLSSTTTVQIVDNSPPVLTGSGTPTNFQENGPPVAVDPGLTVTDADGPSETLDGAFVTIAGGFVAAEDVLAFTPVAGITGSYNPASGVLTLSGTATVGDYQTALRSVTYDNTDPNAAPDSRTISFSIAPGALYNPDTGHFYDYIGAPDIRWTEARAAATASSLFGLQGYLATITSQQENDFAASKMEETGWIGASDAAVEGQWRWVTGPEGLETGGGRLFWQGDFTGAPVPGEYENWNIGEPNNQDNAQQPDPAGEDYGHMIFSPLVGPLGTWNDLANRGPFAPYIPLGYLIEYGGMPGDPTLSLSSTTTVNIVAHNSPPVLGDPESAAAECGNVAEGQTATVTAAFNDPDVLDTHTATIDWGDGTAATNATITESGGSGSLAGGHVYAAGGIYTVTITVRDQLGATDTASLDLLITGAGVHGGVLQILGTAEDDQVVVNQQADGTLKVHASYLTDSPRTYSGAGVTGVYILLCEGNDHGDASAAVTVPTVIDGGEGNDFLAAGPRSLLIGGTGSDRLVGGRNVDVLVAGSLRPSVNLGTQLAVAGGTATLSATDVLDDGVADLLTRVSGLDVVFTGTADTVTGP